MRPINDKILVKVATDEEVTASGIILTSAKAERKYEGTVVAVGENEDISKYGVHVGDYVYYTKGMNIEYIEDNVTYDLVSVYDVLAVSDVVSKED